MAKIKREERMEPVAARLLRQREAAQKRHEDGRWISGAHLSTGMSSATRQPHSRKRLGLGEERQIQWRGKRGGS